MSWLTGETRSVSSMGTHSLSLPYRYPAGMLCVREHGVAYGARVVGWLSVQEHAFCYWVFMCTILQVHYSGTVNIAVFRKTIVASGPNGACGEAAGWNDLTDEG